MTEKTQNMEKKSKGNFDFKDMMKNCGCECFGDGSKVDMEKMKKAMAKFKGGCCSPDSNCC